MVSRLVRGLITSEGVEASSSRVKEDVGVSSRLRDWFVDKMGEGTSLVCLNIHGRQHDAMQCLWV